jgi:hypothetical protein
MVQTGCGGNPCIFMKEHAVSPQTSTAWLTREPNVVRRVERLSKQGQEEQQR